MSDFAAALAGQRKPLIRYAMHLVSGDFDAAEDLAAWTLGKAWQHRDKFQVGTNLPAWTQTILRNRFITQMRRKRWDGGSTEDLAISALPWVPAPQGAVVDLADTLKALAMLPQDMREALILVGAGASYEEAAQDLGCAVGTIKSRVARGRDALKELLS